MAKRLLTLAQNLRNCLRRNKLVNRDSLKAHLEELTRKHRALDEHITDVYRGIEVTDEVRRLKTQKLWLKDEIHRIARQLEENVNGSE